MLRVPRPWLPSPPFQSWVGTGAQSLASNIFRVSIVIASSVFCSQGSFARPTYRLTADAASTSLSLYGRHRTSEGFDLKLPYRTLYRERITRVFVGGGSDAVPNPYGIGGSRFSNCSTLEAVRLCEKIAVKESNRSYSESNRRGTTAGIRGVSEFKSHYPEWEFKYDVGDMLEWIHTKATKNVLKFGPGCLTETWSP